MSESSKNEEDRKAAKKKGPSFAEWHAAQLELLEMEQTEGIAKHESKRLQVTKLQLVEVRIGAFGKVNLTLSRDKSLSSCGIQPGNPVRLVCPKWRDVNNQEGEQRGIVKAIDEHMVELICKKGGVS
jgi:hypothetical protein